MKLAFDNAALRVWLAAISCCFSRFERIGLMRTGRTNEATGESNTWPVILSLLKYLQRKKCSILKPKFNEILISVIRFSFTGCCFDVTDFVMVHF